MTARVAVIVAAVWLAGISPSHAQKRLPVGTHVGMSTAPASSTAGVYDEGGGRDPFVSLLVSKKAAAPPAFRPRTGLSDVALADVAIKGTVHTGTTIVAVLEAPGGRSFVGHAKDRLQDATIKTIELDGVTFTQQVVDALGVARTRDVRKPLRQTIVEEDK